MVLHKTQLYLFAMAFIALAVVARTGPVVDLLLLALTGVMSLALLRTSRMPARVRWVMVSFGLLFLLYLTLTGIKPSRTGIINVMGVAISGIVFFFFVRHAEQLVRARWSGLLLFAFGLIIVLVGVTLGMVNKNTVSGIAAYFFLSAGTVWVARGASVLRIGLVMFGTLTLLGFALDHRLMAGSGAVLFGFLLFVRLVPFETIRTLALVVLVGGIVGMLALFAGLWGLDIRDFDEYFREYTGRTARSGRQIIWPLILAFTAQSPWFGLGTGVTFQNLYNSDWSAHSYFLQIYMQTGLVGVTSLILLFATLWIAIGRPQRDQPVRLFATGCFLFLLLHAAFEVFLMQVNLLMGCAAWMMMGLGVGCIRRSGTTAARPSVPPEPQQGLPV